MKNLKKMLLSLIVMSSLVNAENAFNAESVNSWSNEFQLYGLAVWIQGNSTLGKLPKAKVDMGPDDIVKNLKMGAMLHYEGLANNGWGIWLDYAFMNLGFEGKISSEKTELLQVDGNTGVYQGIMEAFIKYQSRLDMGYIDYYGGIRWWHNNFDFDFDLGINGNKIPLVNTSKTYDWYDPVIGIRWNYPINEKWSIRLRGDIGGFGIASNFTAAIETVALYNITDIWQLKMSFKSLWVDYEEGSKGTADYFSYDTTNFGPIVAITYKF
jgi:hypothetical protein